MTAVLSQPTDGGCGPTDGGCSERSNEKKTCPKTTLPQSVLESVMSIWYLTALGLIRTVLILSL